VHECRRIVALASFGQDHLVKKDLRQVGEARIVLLGIQGLYQRMVRIDLEDWLLTEIHLLTSFLHDPLHVQAHPVHIGNQTGRRLGQAVTEPHFADLVLQNFLDLVQHRLKILVDFFLMLFLFLVVQFA
jgi:hypothetical protein